VRYYAVIVCFEFQVGTNLVVYYSYRISTTDKIGLGAVQTAGAASKIRQSVRLDVCTFGFPTQVIDKDVIGESFQIKNAILRQMKMM
jgi:hypothetical protein